jgi:hypothetical protein
MADPVAGLREMARVSKAAGVVAACVWDNAGGCGPLWRAAQDLDPAISDESVAAGAREGHLAELARDAGLERAQSSRLTVEVPFEAFEAFGEWWEPLTLGVGSGGAYVHDSRSRAERVLGPAPFTVSASAWCVRAEVADSA